MLKLGLKGSTIEKQFLNRIKSKPDIFEFHLNEDDLFGEKLTLLKAKMEFLNNLGIEIFLHQPMTIGGQYLHMNKTNCSEADFLRLTTRIIVGLCKEFNAKCVVHINYGVRTDNYKEESIFSTEEQYKEVIQKTIEFLDEFDEERKYILIENGCMGVGAYRQDMILANLLSKENIRLCIDISHLAISLNDEEENKEFYTEEDYKVLNQYILNTVSLLKDKTDYYHVVDTKAYHGKHDSIELGKGVIDFSLLIPFFEEKPYIYEVGLKDFNECQEMLNSHQYLLNLKIK